MAEHPHILRLSRRDSERLAEDLLNPPAPSPELVKAAEEYRRAIRAGWLRSVDSQETLAM